MNALCLHPEYQIIIVSNDFEEWEIADTETIFHCQQCKRFKFVHEHGGSPWVTFDNLIEQVQKMRSFDVFYPRHLDPDQFTTAFAKSQKSDVMRFLDEYEECEPDMYGDDIQGLDLYGEE